MIGQDETDLCTAFNYKLTTCKTIFKKLYSKRVRELKKQDIIFNKSLKLI